MLIAACPQLNRQQTLSRNVQVCETVTNINHFRKRDNIWWKVFGYGVVVETRKHIAFCDWLEEETSGPAILVQSIQRKCAANGGLWYHF